MPKDINKFSWKEAENLSYNVVSGRNLLLALKDLDKEGRLTSLKTLKNKKVLCYIIKTNSAIAMNYSNLRLKDIQSYYTEKPSIQSLLTIHQGLRKELGDKESHSAVIEYAKSLGFVSKDRDPLSRMMEYPSEHFDKLVDVLYRYQMYRLLDSKCSDQRILAKLKIGSLFPLTKVLFRRVAKIPSSLLVENYDALVSKIIRLLQITHDI